MASKTFPCPICHEDITVTIEYRPKLIHTAGNGRKGFFTVDCSSSGIEHTCSPDRFARPLGVEGDERE